MAKNSLIFFGSFQNYSTQVLKGLLQSDTVEIKAVVSTPPRPAGRNQALKSTHTHDWAASQNLPVHTPEVLNEATLRELPPTDLFLTAGYGNLLPKSWLTFPKIAALNLHFSLLPKYRGANPAEWALLCGEIETGNTLIEMDANIDSGSIIAQTPYPIEPLDTRVSVYEKLYQLGGETIGIMLEHYLSMKSHPHYEPQPQPTESPTPYAKLLKRNDGFISWLTLKKALQGKAISTSDLPRIAKAAAEFDATTHPLTFIERLSRALYQYPGLWTTVPTKKGKKRLKIHQVELHENKLKLLNVQLEGQKPAHFNQIKNLILLE